MLIFFASVKDKEEGQRLPPARCDFTGWRKDGLGAPPLECCWRARLSHLGAPYRPGPTSRDNTQVPHKCGLNKGLAASHHARLTASPATLSRAREACSAAQSTQNQPSDAEATALPAHMLHWVFNTDSRCLKQYAHCPSATFEGLVK